MSGLAPQYVRAAAYVVGEEIRRRQQFGHPVPLSLRELEAALNCAMSAREHRERRDLSTLRTTKQLAAEWRCTTRTVRRKAEAAGGQLIAGRWIFPEDT